jgi:putative nucleotidyltransferase with HDIG domain
MPGLSRRSREELMALLAQLFERRLETLQHSRRVASYALLVAIRMKGLIDPVELELAALLHDIGKLALPEDVINKPGPLSDEEWLAVHRHSETGFRMLSSIPGMEAVAELVYAHHEHFDGSGYPRGVSGEAIPLGARIFSVVDSFDAMTSDRPYRRALSCPAGRAEIRRLSGMQFDPHVASRFLDIPEADLENIMLSDASPLSSTGSACRHSARLPAPSALAASPLTLSSQL